MNYFIFTMLLSTFNQEKHYHLPGAKWYPEGAELISIPMECGESLHDAWVFANSIAPKTNARVFIHGPWCFRFNGGLTLPGVRVSYISLDAPTHFLSVKAHEIGHQNGAIEHERK